MGPNPTPIEESRDTMTTIDRTTNASLHPVELDADTQTLGERIELGPDVTVTTGDIAAACDRPLRLRLTAAGLAGAGDLDVTNNGGRTGRFGRFLGRGLSRDEAIERMEGATLECLGILAVMRPAVRAWKAEEELPLLVHLMEVGLDGAPVALPFERFFGGATG